MKTLRELIEESNNIVFFGGAGVSTESNIPDFRSESGLFHAREIYGRSPEALVSHSTFVNEPELFYDYYKKNLVFPDAQPNNAHIALAKLEEIGKLKAVITQNVDGLHQKAGSKTVYELHGSVHRNQCLSCGKMFTLDYILDDSNCVHKNGKQGSIPWCDECGFMIKPVVVLYEEALDDSVVTPAINAIAAADLLIVGGTSLVVYPAAGYLGYFRGENIVLINKSKTGMDNRADLVINEPIGEVLKEFI